MGSLLGDIRLGFRALRRSPGFSIMALLVLTIGIGANTAIFSIVNAVLLRQLPFQNPERLVSLWSKRTDGDKYPTSIADFNDLRQQSRSLQSMAAYAFSGMNLTGHGDAERVQTIRVSGDFFEVVGATALLGRPLLVADDHPGSPRVAVMTFGLWQRRFGGDSGILGKTVELNGESYNIVGVMPANFFFPIRASEIALPLVAEADPRRADRGDHFLNVVGLLRAGVSLGSAAAELDSITQRLKQQYPATNAKNAGVTLLPLNEEIVGKFQASLWILLGAVTMLLLIACASLANLLLARASARRREIAIRTALGASRPRIIGQFVTETVILSLLGGTFGVLLAVWGVQALLALGPADLPRASSVGIDAHVVFYAAMLSLICGLLFGIVPALQSANPGFEYLRASGALAETVGRGRKARAIIVAVQVALSVILLVGAGLLLKSFSRLQAVQPGFDPSHALTVRLSLPQESFATREQFTNFYTELRGRIESLPGVKSASAVSILPLSGPLGEVDFTIVGRPPASKDHVPGAEYRVTGPGYLRTMSIPLLQGRDFVESDNGGGAPVALINQTLARKFFPSGDAVGSHLQIEDSGQVKIVGVVGDVKQFALDEDPGSNIYVPYAQVPSFVLVYLRNNMFWVIRTDGDPRALTEPVRQQIRTLHSDLPVSRIGPLEDYLAASVAPRRFNLLLVAMFGGIALLLAILGVYAVVSYSVTRRTREFGVRMALGARPSNILGVVLGSAISPIGIGLASGLAGALWCSRYLEGLLYSVRPTDAITFLAVTFMVAAIALLASLIPAFRATKADPMVALRYE